MVRGPLRHNFVWTRLVKRLELGPEPRLNVLLEPLCLFGVLVKILEHVLARDFVGAKVVADTLPPGDMIRRTLC